MKLDRGSKITLGIIAAVLVVAAFFTFVRTSSVNPESLPSDNLVQAEGYSFLNLDDEPVSLEQFRGQVVVVNVWASWCPFCVTELPDFDALAAAYADRGVVVLAINRAEQKSQIKSYLATVPTLANLQILQDKEDSFYEFIGGFSMPETVFYDAEGNIAHHKRGFMELEEMQQLLDTVLAAE